MFFRRQASPTREALTLFTLLALCTLALILHFHTSTTALYRDIKYLHLTLSPSPDPSSIPKILWYKLDAGGLNNDTETWTGSCIAANPDWDVQFLTDEDAEDFVYSAFSNRPDILEVYSGLSVPVLRRDMLRYLLLYDQGGVWVDVDVSCEDIPIDHWVPAELKDSAGLVVGWEFDVGWSPGIMRQFATWVVMARPGSPHMLTVVEDIVGALHGVMKEHGVGIGEVTLNMTGDVVDFSGPRRLTAGVFKSLEHTLERSVSPDEAKEIMRPVILGDVVVMPGRSFASSMNNYGGHGGGAGLLLPQLVTYHYTKKEKNDEGGEE